jgi:hypothetical protein
MKFETTKDKNERFQPFDLTIKVESLEDLTSLWHRFNLNISSQSKGCLSSSYVKGFMLPERRVLRLPSVEASTCVVLQIWKDLDNKLREEEKYNGL